MRVGKSFYFKALLTFGISMLALANLWASSEERHLIQTIESAKVVSSTPKLSSSLVQLARPLPKLTPARKNKWRLSGEPVPGEDLIKEVPNRNYPFAKKYLAQNKVKAKDTVLQSKQKSDYRSPLVPQILVGFDGMDNVQGSVPPDTNADVGPNHIVQMVNSALAIWDKSGNQLLAPVAINTLWDDFGGLCESTNRGDPIVLYDSSADRWLISQFAFNDGFTDNRQCIAISQTGDPTGAYYLYDFLYSNTKFNDYPHYGVWHNGYYAGVNQFVGDDYAGAGVVAYERDKMLVGQTARQVIFDLEGVTPDAFTPMPADIDGIFLPPSQMPQYFVSAGGRAGTIDVWQFDLDWENVGQAAFAHLETLDTAPYDGAVCNFDRNCVDQPGGQQLDSIPQRMMFRLAYRNLGGSQHKLVANHTVVGESVEIPGVRWYEMDISGTDGSVSIANQGTYSLGDGVSRWMGSAAMDAVGNIAVAYSASSSSVAPSLRFSGRELSDPADTLTVVEQVLKAGEGSQSGSSRWGDYSSLSVDPSDDCTFWYTNEYYQSSSNATTSWSTYIGSFKFPNCVTGPSGFVSGRVTDASTGNGIADVLVTVGATSITSDQNGDYEIRLPEGNDYSLTFFKYGWQSSIQSGVDVAEDQTVNLDVSLSSAVSVSLAGNVRDGSGLNRPLFAKITITAPGSVLTTFTDPSSGNYTIDLFADTLVKVSAESVVEGYLSESIDIVPNGSNTQDFSLLVDKRCIAAGYGFLLPSFYESFESGVPPSGWSVEDNSGSTVVWGSALAGIGNLLDTDGDAALINSDQAGESVTVSTTLTSPEILVSELDTLTVSFSYLFRTFQGRDRFSLEIRKDGDRWETLVPFSATNRVEEFDLDLTNELIGVTRFQLRWNYDNAMFEWYALVDNVRFGQPVCQLQQGSLVQGTVQDGNTNESLADALVTVVDSSPLVEVRTTDAGYFEVFVREASSGNIRVSSSAYQDATLAASEIELTTPIELEAGLLSVDEQSLDLTAFSGAAFQNFMIPIVNQGSVDAEYSLLITQAEPLPNGPFHPSARHFGPKNLTDITAKKRRDHRDYTRLNIAQDDAEIVGWFETTINGWGLGINQESDDFWVGNLVAKGGDSNSLHRFANTGEKLTDIIDTDSITNDFSADVAYNNRTGMFWQVSVGGDANCIYEIDPTAMQLTGESICPEVGVSQRGLTYDPITGTFYSGSWVDSIIHQFDENGTILRSVNVGVPIAGLAINPVSGRLYVHANDESPNPDIVVLDTNTLLLDALESYDYPDDDLNEDGTTEDTMTDFEQGGLALSCDGTLWGLNLNSENRDTQFVIGLNMQETDVCDWENASNFNIVGEVSGIIPADSTKDIELSINATNLEAGDYETQLIVSNNTPYGDLEKTISVSLTEPSIGSLQFQNNNIKIDNSKTVTLVIERVGGSDLPIAISYATVDGNARAGDHYDEVSGTLSWENGEVEPKTIIIQTKSTSGKEFRDFKVVLSNPSGGVTLGEQFEATVTIRGAGAGAIGIMWSSLLLLIYFMRRRAVVRGTLT